MNSDLIILLKFMYENANDTNHHILKLDEIVVAFNKNKSQLERMMAVEEGLLKEKVSQAKGTFLNYVDKREWVGGSSNVNFT